MNDRTARKPDQGNEMLDLPHFRLYDGSLKRSLSDPDRRKAFQSPLGLTLLLIKDAWRKDTPKMPRACREQFAQGKICAAHSGKSLAEALGVARSTINKWLAEAERLGWLRKPYSTKASGQRMLIEVGYWQPHFKADGTTGRKRIYYLNEPLERGALFDASNRGVSDSGQQVSDKSPEGGATLGHAVADAVDTSTRGTQHTESQHRGDSTPALRPDGRVVGGSSQSPSLNDSQADIRVQSSRAEISAISPARANTDLAPHDPLVALRHRLADYFVLQHCAWFSEAYKVSPYDVQELDFRLHDYYESYSTDETDDDLVFEQIECLMLNVIDYYLRACPDLPSHQADPRPRLGRAAHATACGHIVWEMSEKYEGGFALGNERLPIAWENYKDVDLRDTKWAIHIAEADIIERAAKSFVQHYRSTSTKASDIDYDITWKDWDAAVDLAHTILGKVGRWLTPHQIKDINTVLNVVDFALGDFLDCAPPDAAWLFEPNTFKRIRALLSDQFSQEISSGQCRLTWDEGEADATDDHTNQPEVDGW